jgi:RF-1 domain
MEYRDGMRETHPAALPDEQLLADCDVRHERRSGPGGQHRNKVATAVVLVHRPTGLQAEASERRSQAENRAQALRRLRLRLALEVRASKDGAKPARPSLLWQSRVAGERLVINPSHNDFPALLAEALDALAVAHYDIPAAAGALGVTSSQLARLLKREPPAWNRLNEARRERGLRPLH